MVVWKRNEMEWSFFFLVFHPFRATWRVSAKPADDCFISFPAPFWGIKGCKQKRKHILWDSNHQSCCFGRKQQMREGQRIFGLSVSPPFDKTPVKSKCTSSVNQACRVRVPWHLSPPPPRLLAHHPPGLTWLCYMKITFLHLKSQHSHASVTHRTPSRHVSVLLNNVLQFPSAFWWINKCYTLFYHNFVFAVCLKVIFFIVYALF